MKPLSIAFHHFGCKVNFAEASSLSRQFADKGYHLTNFHDRADIYVISSCVVTATAEKKCRAAIRQAHALNPNAKIAVIGCFPELKANEVTKMEGVDIVLGHQGKFNLLQEIEGQGRRSGNQDRGVGAQSTGHRAQGEEEQIKDSLSWIPDHESPITYKSNIEHRTSKIPFVPSYSVGDRTRSFLKIQDGCDYHCSYCAIPLARGKSRSDTIAHILDEAREIVDSGVKEIILTGVNIGDFGKHNGETLIQLLTELEKEIRIPRIRISSIEPDLLHDEIIELVSCSEKFLPHFHIPLQSGCNGTLRAMKRKYTTTLFSSRVEKIRATLPYACIAADVIVGFPGESEADFQTTYSFLEQLSISYMHVFTYSKRENTLASKAFEMVPRSQMKERSDLLHHLSDVKKQLFYQSNKGRKSAVLFESDNKNGMMHGFTENYIKVKTTFDPSLVNEIRSVRLEKLDDDLCYEVMG